MLLICSFKLTSVFSAATSRPKDFYSSSALSLIFWLYSYSSDKALASLWARSRFNLSTSFSRLANLALSRWHSDSSESGILGKAMKRARRKLLKILIPVWHHLKHMLCNILKINLNSKPQSVKLIKWGIKVIKRGSWLISMERKDYLHLIWEKGDNLIITISITIQCRTLQCAQNNWRITQ